jgi:outer membrane protein OmpA-like peptidoglycan-associated protein
LVYNLLVSQRRADWVKQALIAKGTPKNRIVLTVGWGQLYPVCPELNDDCWSWSKNRLVRLAYSPH